MYTLGPQNAQLLVHTRRTGAAAMAGHDLTIEVTSWSGTLDLDSEREVTLKAAGGSLQVREGKGGMQTLGDDDRASIKESIDKEVLKRASIEFRSQSVEGAERLRVQGELAIGAARHPLTFELNVAEDRLTGRATLRQSDFRIKPFSALFGTLKVVDEVEVTIEGRLGS